MTKEEIKQDLLKIFSEKMLLIPSDILAGYIYSLLERQKREVVGIVQGIQTKFPELESDDFDNGCAETKKIILENLKFI